MEPNETMTPEEQTPASEMPPEAPETPAAEETPAASGARNEAGDAPQTLSDLLAGNAEYQRQYEAMLEDQRTAWEAETRRQLEEQLVNWELTAALTAAGARNHKAVLALMDRDQVQVKDGKVSGITEQLEALRRSDSYLFSDNGNRPYFSTGSSGGNPGTSDEATVAARYKHNPWYHG